MNTSDKIDQIAASLFALRKELKQPTADQTADAGSYSYPYLSLPALIEFLDSKIMSLSLSYTQEVTRGEDGANVTTRIMHSSGQWIELGPLFLPVKGNAQAWGSAISYGRRYALAAAFGISSRGEDDDAVSASSSPTLTSSEADTGTRGRDGDAERGTEAPYGEGGASVPTINTPPTAQELMERFHPGKPHKRIKSETVPGMTYCDIKHPSEGVCTFSVYTEGAKV